MDLGQRLRQARLEAGLSQRQLCGDTITRNMLSLIENGSASPSMDTLRYLASRLDKPMGYFLEEQAVTSPNQSLMVQAKDAWDHGDAQKVLDLLQAYQEPDPLFDAERWLLEALACFRFAEQVLSEGKPAYAQTLLEQGQLAGSRTPYYTRELQRSAVLLAYKIRPERAGQLASQLPDLLPELLLWGQAALDEKAYARCGAVLDAAMPCDDPTWQLLRADAYLGLKAYASAIPLYLQAEATYPKRAAIGLEHCYRETEDYKSAYLYACKLRDMG